MAKMSKGKKVGIGGIAAAIIGMVLVTEGGYVDNPKDPGGATNHGVTEKVARDHGYTGHMRDLSKEAAQSIYFTDYIEKPGYAPLIEIQPAVAYKLVDIGVNAGPGRSSRWFQQSLNAFNRDGKDYPQLTVDGKVGPGTIRAYQSLEKVRGKVKACELTIKVLDSYQAQHYVNLTNLKTFTVGWVDHRIGNVPLSACSNFEGTFNVESGY